MKKKKVLNPPLLTKENERFSPLQMSYFLIMSPCNTKDTLTLILGLSVLIFFLCFEAENVLKRTGQFTS